VVDEAIVITSVIHFLMLSLCCQSTEGRKWW